MFLDIFMFSILMLFIVLLQSLLRHCQLHAVFVYMYTGPIACTIGAVLYVRLTYTTPILWCYLDMDYTLNLDVHSGFLVNLVNIF